VVEGRLSREAKIIIRELELLGYAVVRNNDLINVITLKDKMGALFLLNYGRVDPEERATKKWWVRKGSHYTQFYNRPEDALEEAAGWIRDAE
jgi:hypothetical protein